MSNEGQGRSKTVTGVTVVTGPGGVGGPGGWGGPGRVPRGP
jgi:hypothetical protein